MEQGPRRSAGPGSKGRPSPTGQSSQLIAALSAMATSLQAAYGTPRIPANTDVASDIVTLRRQVASLSQSLREAEATQDVLHQQRDELGKKLEELTEKEILKSVLDRISNEAGEVLLASKALSKSFMEAQKCHSYVVSIDLRRSTDLMLKARSAERFAAFITQLCLQLREVAFHHDGVFDKFTGDGVLLFFPDFFSGEDAGYKALAMADDCHRLFEQHYMLSRSAFVSVPKDIGLGIGIDYGEIHLVRMAGVLTIVGVPVVYACRMSGGVGGVTLLNQPAYEEVSGKFGRYCMFTEVERNMKSEGAHVAYAVRLNRRQFTPHEDGWRALRQQEEGSGPRDSSATAPSS